MLELLMVGNTKELQFCSGVNLNWGQSGKPRNTKGQKALNCLFEHLITKHVL